MCRCAGSGRRKAFIAPLGESMASPVSREAAGWLRAALAGGAGGDALKGDAVSCSCGVPRPGTDDLYPQPDGFPNIASGGRAVGGCAGIWHGFLSPPAPLRLDALCLPCPETKFVRVLSSLRVACEPGSRSGLVAEGDGWDVLPKKHCLACDLYLCISTSQ